MTSSLLETNRKKNVLMLVGWLVVNVFCTAFFASVVCYFVLRTLSHEETG